MYCPNCNHEIPDGSRFCLHCGAMQTVGYQPPYEPGRQINWVPYLVLSILTTICCCIPFGIVGIVYAAKINSAINAGDYAEAERSARNARIWIIAAAVIGVIVNIAFIAMAYVGTFGSYYYYYY